MFSVPTTQEGIESATVTGHFGFAFEKNSCRNSPDYCDVIVFEKLRVPNVFPSTLKRTACGFEFFRFEERFRKAPFW